MISEIEGTTVLGRSGGCTRATGRSSAKSSTGAEDVTSYNPESTVIVDEEPFREEPGRR